MLFSTEHGGRGDASSFFETARLYASPSEPMMPAMERVTLEDLRGPGATLGAGVSAGFVAGVLIGGVGGRLAMLALRLTSDPSLHGVLTDDGFTIGRVSVETLFLLGVTAGLGMVGGLFYLVVRRWIPSRRRIPLRTVFGVLV